MTDQTDTERRLLSAVLFHPERFGEIAGAGIRADYFLDPEARAVFAAALELWRRGEEPNGTALSLHMDQATFPGVGKWGAWLREVGAECGTSAHLAYDVRTLRRMRALREMRRRAAQILDEADRVVASNEESVDEFLDGAADRVYRVLVESREHRGEGPAKAGKAIHALLEEFARPGASMQRYTTGIVPLDRYLLGLTPGQLVVIAARASVGKTTFALQLVCDIAAEQRVPVLIDTLEMSTAALCQKIMARYARVNSQSIGFGMSAAHLSTISEAMAKVDSAPVWLWQDNSSSLDALLATIKSEVAKHETKIVLVDYLQLLRGPRVENRAAEVAAISRALKRVALETGVCVVALSQLNRQADQAEPTLSQLRESGAIEQDADVVIFLWPDDWKDSGHRVKVHCRVAKNREGQVGTCSLWFDKPTCRFEPCAAETVTFEEPASARRSEEWKPW